MSNPKTKTVLIAQLLNARSICSWKLEITGTLTLVSMTKLVILIGSSQKRRLWIDRMDNYVGIKCYRWVHTVLDGEFISWHYSYLDEAKYYHSSEILSLFVPFSPF